MRGLAAAVALLVAGAASAEPCIGVTCNFDTLEPALKAMTRADMGGAPFHVLQIGDSHTAGDVLTHAWRTLNRARQGYAGRGVLPPGVPYVGYRARGVRVTMSPGWRIAASFGPGSAPPRPWLGLSGFTLTADQPGARMALTDEVGAFSRFVLCGIAQPGAGVATVRFDGDDYVFDFAAAVEAPRCFEIDQSFPMTEVSLTTSRGPVSLTSWGTFTGIAGMTLSNLGIVGSQLMHFARTDDAVLAEELRVYRPDLIVLAFGTNEGFGPRIDGEAYQALLAGQVARLRALSGDVPILLLGAPDALSKRPALRGGASDCPGAPGWFPPPGLAQVRAVQRRVAEADNVAFWDWQARMGGRCSAVRWVAQGRMAADHVHFRDAGGAVLAQALYDDLWIESHKIQSHRGE